MYYGIYTVTMTLGILFLGYIQVEDFICIADRAYSQEQILGMEKSILNRLEWSLTVPTPYVFLVRFIKAAICDKEVRGKQYLIP